jgi:uncharacterized protein (DUF433 family)
MPIFFSSNKISRGTMAAEQRTQGLLDRIIQDPNILVGKPVVRGTRIPVELVLAKLAANPDVQELLADYPRLTIDDVKACLAYAERLVEQQQKATYPAAPIV